MTELPGDSGPYDIEVDGDASSSTDVDDASSELASLTSSILTYVYENGRTYHAYRPGTYVLPNDEREQDRLDCIHHVFRLCLDGELCQTKLEHPQSILDIGTGTGIWAIEMADEYPMTEVIGVDLSPIQPGWSDFLSCLSEGYYELTVIRVPPNLRFIIDDANQPWIFPSQHFDFIHIRGMCGSVENWPSFLRQCYDHLKPGGRIELAEIVPRAHCDDDSMPENCYLLKWQKEFHRLTAIQGRDWDIMPRMPKLLEEALFDQIEPSEQNCPIGTWPKDPKLKEIGRYFRAQFADSALDSYSLALFTRFSDWKPTEVQVLMAHVRSELNSNKIHWYTKFSFVTAQKPLA
ncbi:S-adenosyl-L-methionine-dependent methyltransferase [Penicillium alfredii]|uniref:S-adenosyl-L-methionine-dependent methyltransferase n=1 Tax=Penicillium alfredii TaxID=1506179 RepID=A0A9W9K807_9EURO|nr:S-adenosyl-L-methionine-dependent methyltransferase [Penicillium alfredii]KAJ5096448.1 S-adenosyl-L-methionine-dependent methyltransferase [Penicillium alfredii]